MHIWKENQELGAPGLGDPELQRWLQTLPHGVERVDLCDAGNWGLQNIEASIITSDHE